MIRQSKTYPERTVEGSKMRNLKLGGDSAERLAQAARAIGVRSER